MRCRRHRVLVLILALVAGCSQEAERKPWPWVVTCGKAKLKVEPVTKPKQQAYGLKNRQHLGENWGMLFIYAEDHVMDFWMQDTRIPLSIAFIDSGLVVRDIQDMEPMTEDSHQSSVPVRYALEVNRGWFARNDIKPGSVLKFSPRLDDLVKKTVKGADDGEE